MSNRSAYLQQAEVQTNDTSSQISRHLVKHTRLSIDPVCTMFIILSRYRWFEFYLNLACVVALIRTGFWCWRCRPVTISIGIVYWNFLFLFKFLFLNAWGYKSLVSLRPKQAEWGFRSARTLRSANSVSVQDVKLNFVFRMIGPLYSACSFRVYC